MLRGHEAEVTSAVFSPDGTRVLTTSLPGGARLWDATTFAEGRVLPNNGLSAAFSPDGALVLTVSWDGRAWLWDAATGAEGAALRGHEGPVTSAAISPDGARVLTASWDGTAIIRPIETLSELVSRIQTRVGTMAVLSDSEQCEFFLRTEGC